MGLQEEQASALNEIIAMIDQKATQFKDEVYDLREAQVIAEKKLIFDLVQSAMDLANQINPRPDEVMNDLVKLRDQLNSL